MADLSVIDVLDFSKDGKILMSASNNRPAQ